MTKTSIISDPDLGWIPRNAKAVLRSFGGAADTFTLTVRESLSKIDQIGKSYRVEGKIPWLGKEEGNRQGQYFLKIPDPVPFDRRDSLIARLQAEKERGEELNALIDLLGEKGRRARTPSHQEVEFKIPRLVQAGTIENVFVGKRSQYADLHGLPFIVYEWIDGKQLDKLTAAESKRLKNNWFSFAKGLAQVVRRLHNHGFLHAYIVPRNILFNKAKAKSTFFLAGFGYSSLSIEEASRPHTTLEGDIPYQAPEFGSGRSLDALWHAADIFSVGAVLFYSATGKTPQLYKKRPDGRYLFAFQDRLDQLKDYVRTNFENPRSGVPLTKRNHNIAKIIDNCIRFNPDHRFETAEELWDAIDVAQTETAAPQRKGKGAIALGAFFAAVRKQKEKEVRDLISRIERRHHFEIYGSRTKIIDGLCRMLGGLPKGAVYRTITLPSYWTVNNLGPDGRFLAMNRHVAKRGIRVERIFLVSGPFHTLPDEEQAILKSQARAANQLGALQVKVRMIPSEQVLNFERSGQSVAFVAYSASQLPALTNSSFRAGRVLGRFLCLNFISRGEEKERYGKRVIERQIRKVRIWDPGRGLVYWNRVKREAENFKNLWGQGSTLPLSQYTAAGTGPTLETLLARGRPQVDTGEPVTGSPDAS
jgi:serine/threonine protein kinase